MAGCGRAGGVPAVHRAERDIAADDGGHGGTCADTGRCRRWRSAAPLGPTCAAAAASIPGPPRTERSTSGPDGGAAMKPPGRGRRSDTPAPSAPAAASGKGSGASSSGSLRIDPVVKTTAGAPGPVKIGGNGLGVGLAGPYAAGVQRVAPTALRPVAEVAAPPRPVNAPPPARPLLGRGEALAALRAAMEERAGPVVVGARPGWSGQVRPGRPLRHRAGRAPHPGVVGHRRLPRLPASGPGGPDHRPAAGTEPSTGAGGVGETGAVLAGPP